eukprot:47083_1
MSSDRNKPINRHIDPRDWKISELNNKNKCALQEMLKEQRIEYDDATTNQIMIELLKDVREEDAKQYKKQIRCHKAQQRARLKKKKTKNKRSSSLKRNKIDPISCGPLISSTFDTTFDQSESQLMDNDLSDHTDHTRSSCMSSDKWRMNMSDYGVDDTTNNSRHVMEDTTNVDEVDNGIEKEEDKQQDEETEESITCVLERIGLKSTQISAIVSQEFEDLSDVLDLTDVDLKECGISLMGERKAVLRKLNGEAKRINTVVEIESGENGNAFQQLLSVLSARAQGQQATNNNVNGNGNGNNVENDSHWLKLPGTKRQCYVGPLKQAWIISYNQKTLAVIMLSLDCTDASAVRAKLQRVTRGGTHNKVRCSYVSDASNKFDKWPHSNIMAVKKQLYFLSNMRLVKIHTEDDGSNEWGTAQGWTATFGRNPISTSFALKCENDLEKAKMMHKWFKKTSDNVDWLGYARRTRDNICGELDLLNDNVDWAKYIKWIESEPELRQAQKPESDCDDD